MNNNNTEDFVARTYPPCWVLKARIQKHRGKPLLLHDKCPGFFYVHYTTHRTYSFTSHPKDESIMVKCLAQGHKRRDRPGQAGIRTHILTTPELSPMSGNIMCNKPLLGRSDVVLKKNQQVRLVPFFSTNNEFSWIHFLVCINFLFFSQVIFFLKKTSVQI